MAERDELLLALGAASIPVTLEAVVNDAEPSVEMLGKYKPRVFFVPEEFPGSQWRCDVVDNTNTSVSGSIGYYPSAAAAVAAVISFYNGLIGA